MPQGNGTGSTGAGPMSGRAAGYCAGFNEPGYMNPLPGGGRGKGFGRGAQCGGGGGRGQRGWRTMLHATGLPGWQRASVVAPTPAQEKRALHAQTDALEQQLAALKQRLNDLEPGPQQ